MSQRRRPSPESRGVLGIRRARRRRRYSPPRPCVSTAARTAGASNPALRPSVARDCRRHRMLGGGLLGRGIPMDAGCWRCVRHFGAESSPSASSARAATPTRSRQDGRTHSADPSHIGDLVYVTLQLRPPSDADRGHRTRTQIKRGVHRPPAQIRRIGRVRESALRGGLRGEVRAAHGNGPLIHRRRSGQCRPRSSPAPATSRVRTVRRSRSTVLRIHQR